MRHGVSGPEDLNLSPESVAELVTDKTAAILVVHYAGYPCDMDAINEIASRHGLRVIEDAAHAPGAAYFSRTGDGGAKVPINVGGLGDVGCFSFFSNKNMATGEGGCCSPVEKERGRPGLRSLWSHGMTSLTLDRYRGHSYSYDVVMGFNYRIDEMHWPSRRDWFSWRSWRRRTQGGGAWTPSTGTGLGMSRGSPCPFETGASR